MKKNERFSVFVGGIEVNDYLMSYIDASKLKMQYQSEGYDDVQIVSINNK